jgi:two-component system response regulator FixJ
MTPRSVYVIDEDRVARRAIVTLLRDHGFAARPYIAAQDFIDALFSFPPGCVLVGTLGKNQLPAIIQALGPRLSDYPVIAFVASGDVAGAVQAMKLGATDAIEGIADQELLPAILASEFDALQERVIDAGLAHGTRTVLADLPPREYDILRGLVGGLSSKEIAAILRLNLRTIELSRGKMMQRLQVRTLADVLQLAFKAGVTTLGVSASGSRATPYQNEELPLG